MSDASDTETELLERDPVGSHRFLSSSELSILHRTISNWTHPIEAWVNAAPALRDPSLLGRYIDLTTSIMSNLIGLETSIPPPFFRRLRIDLSHLQDTLDHIQDDLEVATGLPACPPGRKWTRSKNQRWMIDIDEEVLKCLVDVDMTDREIAGHFGCSIRTVQRHREALNLRRRDYNGLDDEDLKGWINYVREMGGQSDGYRAIHVNLKNEGINVPRDRVRKLCAEVDPYGVSARLSTTVVRRTYRVPWINALWHIDGHHKLIRWKIVIHGGIDGYSRMVTFLHASTNNEASTVTECFLHGVEAFGWPSRVRVDYGKENLGVKAEMERVRGLNCGSFIQGPSTRNQRIERLWVDLQAKCTNRFKTLFNELENRGELDVDNPLDMWALHVCFLPMLNGYIRWYIRYNNTHGIRTAGYQSPNQLWMRSRLRALSMGIDIHANCYALLGNDEPEVQGRGAQAFIDYGVDTYGRRAMGQPKDTDPYVTIEPVLERADGSLARFLDSPHLRKQMDDLLGPAYPPPEDFGLKRYQLCRTILSSIVKDRFPHLMR